jgi:hypothetical protein
MRLSRAFLVLAAFGIGGCAASPLYVEGRSARSWAGAEIPRDARGEPMWDLIRPPAMQPSPSTAPVMSARGWTPPPPAEGDSDDIGPQPPR